VGSATQRTAQQGAARMGTAKVNAARGCVSHTSQRLAEDCCSFLS
jgi:hypothetical protein